MTKRLVKMLISAEVIAQALGIQDDAEIRDIYRRNDLAPGTFVLVLEHPSLPLVIEGAEPPLADMWMEDGLLMWKIS